MNLKNLLKSALCVILCTSTLASCAQKPTAFTPSDSTVDLTANLTANTVTGKRADFAFRMAQADFAASLFSRVCESESGNVLISPASVVLALAMTANGASGDTLAEMETAFGLKTADLNPYLYSAYIDRESDGVLSVADSIWIRDVTSLHVEDAFLQTNKDYYDAEIYKAAFDDVTVADINNWCAAQTDGMIKKILDELSADDVMHLINAVCFNGEWQDKYKEKDVQTATFTNASGTKRSVSMMYSDEWGYYSYGGATGFKKPYKNGYSFVAMLPAADTDIDVFLSNLTGGFLVSFLDSAEGGEVSVGLPRFKSDFHTSLNAALQGMGVQAAFDGGKADFSKLGNIDGGNLYIGEVNHFTHIEVDENGTKAAAITDVGMKTLGNMDPKRVILDRPFVYMIIDEATRVPLFLGVTKDIN